MNPTEQRDATISFLNRVAPDAEFVAACASRIDTEGSRQYYDAEGDTMLFETMSPDALYEYAEEEALDLANYAYMIYVRAAYPGESAVAAGLAWEARGLWRLIRGARQDRQGAEMAAKVVTRS